jgi:hypothetical protein
MPPRKKKPKPKPPAGPPKIHEATLASGPSGAVLKGAEIDLEAAIARREAGLDVVVCGDDIDANRGLAYAVESSVGPCKRQDPHDEAGPHALPHFQQGTPPPAGHCFYEATSREKKARKQR